MKAIANEGWAIVTDGVEVLRISEVIRRANASSVRAVADELGFEYTTLWRYLRANGYRPVHTWAAALRAEEGEGA